MSRYWILRPIARLTLVTCYPFNYIGSAPKRFIVQAKQIGFEELASRGKTQTGQQLLSLRGKQESEQLLSSFRIATSVGNHPGLDDRLVPSAGMSCPPLSLTRDHATIAASALPVSSKLKSLPYIFAVHDPVLERGPQAFMFESLLCGRLRTGHAEDLRLRAL